MKNRSSIEIFATILSVLACFALLPQMLAAPDVAPPPDGCYPGFTTAEGCNALAALTTGAGNTGLGWHSLHAVTTGSFNTGVGAGALILNTGTSNTAVGVAALLLNTTGGQNTAVGTDALVYNSAGIGDTAIGYFALEHDNGSGSNTATGNSALVANTTGFNNAAYGIRALESNIDGQNNTAIGNLALDLNDHGMDNVALGRHAGDGITGANNNIVIGHGSGVHSRFGQQDNVCYIQNIYGANVNNLNQVARLVYVDPDGRLGTVLVADGPNPGKSPERGQPEAMPDAQAMLNRKVKALEATVAELRGQLKEQAALIQKVSAQLEMAKPATKVVLGNQ